jgi:5-methylthioribose kinase
MNSTSASFARAFPHGFLVDPDARGELEKYLHRRGWLEPGESLVSIARAGEGNMNLTLRLETATRSFVLKQARPWVEKYPSIEAPAGRARVEAAFYRTVAGRSALRTAMPALLGDDPDSGILVLEDLGEARDATGLYRREALAEGELETLVSCLLELHRPFPEREPLFENRAMRALNHEHIFRLPLAPENGLDLDRITPGLDRAVQELKDDRAYVRRVRELGLLYLENGDSLVHGDFFPGSWLRASTGLKVIDPEFCFLGTAAFDLGVLCAHLHFARLPELAERALTFYGGDSELTATSRAFAAVEILRRLAGVAQLPLARTLEEKRALLALSRSLL